METLKLLLIKVLNIEENYDLHNSPGSKLQYEFWAGKVEELLDQVAAAISDENVSLQYHWNKFQEMNRNYGKMYEYLSNFQEIMEGEVEDIIDSFSIYLTIS